MGKKMKKILFLCCLLAILCGCNSHKNDALNAILHYLNTTEEEVAMSGFDLSVIKVTKAYNSPLNDGFCMARIEEIIEIEEASKDNPEWYAQLTSARKDEPWIELIELINENEKHKQPIGWEAVVHLKKTNGDGEVARVRFLLNTDFSEVLLLEPLNSDLYEKRRKILKVAKERLKEMQKEGLIGFHQ